MERLPMSRAELHARASGGVMRFTIPFSMTEANKMTDLQTENAALKAQLHKERVDATIEADVRARMCLPAARETFRRMFKLDADPANYSRVTVDDWQQFRGTQRRPADHGAATHGTDASLPDTGPDNRLVEMTKQRIADHYALTQGREKLDFSTAAAAVVHELNRANPHLIRAWLTQPGEV